MVSIEEWKSSWCASCLACNLCYGRQHVSSGSSGRKPLVAEARTSWFHSPADMLSVDRILGNDEVAPQLWLTKRSSTWDGSQIDLRPRRGRR